MIDWRAPCEFDGEQLLARIFIGEDSRYAAAKVT
jgi:hypothetical protein